MGKRSSKFETFCELNDTSISEFILHQIQGGDPINILDRMILKQTYHVLREIDGQRKIVEDNLAVDAVVEHILFELLELWGHVLKVEAAVFAALPVDVFNFLIDQSALTVLFVHALHLDNVTRLASQRHLSVVEQISNRCLGLDLIGYVFLPAFHL